MVDEGWWWRRSGLCVLGVCVCVCAGACERGVGMHVKQKLAKPWGYGRVQRRGVPPHAGRRRRRPRTRQARQAACGQCLPCRAWWSTRGRGERRGQDIDRGGASTCARPYWEGARRGRPARRAQGARAQAHPRGNGQGERQPWWPWRPWWVGQGASQDNVNRGRAGRRSLIFGPAGGGHHWRERGAGRRADWRE